eukprot:5963375-Alexandrium_andersonii.AAC.1
MGAFGGTGGSRGPPVSLAARATHRNRWAATPGDTGEPHLARVSGLGDQRWATCFARVPGSIGTHRN